MPLDPSFAGRTYPPTPAYEVGREKIREFAESVGDLHPAYLDPDAARALGHPDVIAPPTFAIVITKMVNDQVVHDPALGLDYDRVVHGEQRFTYTRPIRAGDRIRGVLVVDKIRAVAGNDILITRIELSGEDGELIVTAAGTLVARGESAEEETA